MAQYPEITPPTVEVSAFYPGANAQVVADTVAAPIEQQVNGVENMMYMSSQCTNDGTYTLTVTFKPGVDLNMAQVLVQNRESLAEPILPDLVKRRGVSVKKKSPSILMIINVFSPDGSRDNLYLSNYATIQLRDELARLDGVGDITYIGQRNYSMRVWLDPAEDGVPQPDRLGRGQCDQRSRTSRSPPASSASRRSPRARCSSSRSRTLGRLTDADQFADMILKTDAQGGVVRLRDVATRRAGRPGLRPGLHARRQAVRRACRSTSGPAPTPLRDRRARPGQDGRAQGSASPTGVDYAIVYDTTPFITESVNEVFKTLARRGHPGGVRGALVPAELAVGARFRWSPCRWRSSAPSRSWPRWASRSTT